MNRTDRLNEVFLSARHEGRPVLVVFLTAGFPDMDATLEVVPALVAAGADVIELGVPFSDPLAEGLTIQESSFMALEQQVTLGHCLGMVESLRAKLPDTPMVLMGYYNPIYSYGLQRFAQDSGSAGVDGLIVVDLPEFESGPLKEHCSSKYIHLIPLLAPTSTEESIRAAVTGATSFIYCISVTGVTGARDQVSVRGFDLVDRVRAYTGLPLAVGFGISRREHVEAVAKKAEAAVVGSALIRVMLDSPRGDLVNRSSAFVAELAGRTTSVVGGPA